MFLHIGNDTVVASDEVVAVFDMENTTISKHSREFLARAQRSGEVTDITDDLPKSYIVTSSGGKTRVYISSVSSRTITKRSKDKSVLSELY